MPTSARSTSGCKTWQGAEGDVKNNLVVLMVSVDDKRTGLYYGEVYRRVLDKQWNGVQKDSTNPRFHDGDFTAGMVAGLGRIAFFVDPSYSPHPNGGGNHHGGGGIAGQPLTGNDAGSVRDPSGASPFVVLGALVASPRWSGSGTAGSCCGGGHVSAQVPARGQRRRAARCRTRSPSSTRAASSPTPASTPYRTSRTLCCARSTSSRRPRAPARATANDRYLAAEEVGPERRIAAMSTAEAVTAATAMDQARDGLLAAIAQWEALTAKLDELDTLRTELPARLDAIAAVAEQTRTTAAAQAQDGFRVDDYVGLTGRYDTEVGEIRALVAAHRVGDADHRAAELDAQAQATLATVDGLARWRDRLRADLDRLRALTADREQELADAKAVAAAIADGYHPECSAGLGDALTAADQDLARVREAIRELDTATAMTEQRWTDGDTLVGEVDRLLAEVADGRRRTARSPSRTWPGLATLLPTGVAEARSAIDVLEAT